MDVTGLFEWVVGAGVMLVPCLMFAGVATLIVLAIVWGLKKARERREACARLAAELGLKYYADDPWNLPGRYSYFGMFDAGHSRSASNVLAGDKDGRPVVMCDYVYKMGSGKDETTHAFQVAILELPITAPRLEMRRESFLDKIATWVGYDELRFESAEFSRQYHVKCDEPKFAYDILHARLIEYLLACGRAPTMAMRGPLMLLAYDGSGDVAVFRRLLEIGEEIVRSIPGYVLTERGTAAALPGGRGQV